MSRRAARFTQAEAARFARIAASLGPIGAKNDA